MTTMHIPHYRKVAHVTSINTGPASPLISSDFQSTSLDSPLLRGYEPWCLMTETRSSSPTRTASPTRRQTRSQTSAATQPQTSTPPPSGSFTTPPAQQPQPATPAAPVNPVQPPPGAPRPHRRGAMTAPRLLVLAVNTDSFNVLKLFNNVEKLGPKNYKI